MQNGLPDNAEKTQAEIEFFTHIRTVADAVRTGERVDLSEVAIQEIRRCDERLALLKRQLKRYGPRNKEKAERTKDAQAASH